MMFEKTNPLSLSLSLSMHKHIIHTQYRLCMGFTSPAQKLVPEIPMSGIEITKQSSQCQDFDYLG